MSNKTPTPIQDLIEQLKELGDDTFTTNEVIEMLQDQQHKERKFAEECFDAGVDCEAVSAPNFSTFYKNNYEDGK